MKAPKNYFSAEITKKGSKFLAEIFPIKLQSEIKPLIKSQKKKYKDARHIAHAFILGENAEILGASDDGEPSGTAGTPILNILKGKKLTNILVTVTRYFGGVLLGTGGLFKAYGEATKLATENCEWEVVAEKKFFEIKISYENYEVLKKIFLELEVLKLKEDFSEEIKIQGKIPKKNEKKFLEKISNATFGKSKIKILSE